MYKKNLLILFILIRSVLASDSETREYVEQSGTSGATPASIEEGQLSKNSDGIPSVVDNYMELARTLEPDAVVDKIRQQQLIELIWPIQSSCSEDAALTINPEKLYCFDRKRIYEALECNVIVSRMPEIMLTERKDARKEVKQNMRSEAVQILCDFDEAQEKENHTEVIHNFIKILVDKTDTFIHFRRSIIDKLKNSSAFFRFFIYHMPNDCYYNDVLLKILKDQVIDLNADMRALFYKVNGKIFKGYYNVCASMGTLNYIVPVSIACVLSAYFFISELYIIFKTNDATPSNQANLTVTNKTNSSFNQSDALTKNTTIPKLNCPNVDIKLASIALITTFAYSTFRLMQSLSFFLFEDNLKQSLRYASLYVASLADNSDKAFYDGLCDAVEKMVEYNLRRVLIFRTNSDLIKNIICVIDSYIDSFKKQED